MGHHLEGGVGEILPLVWFLETWKLNGQRTRTCIKLVCFSAERKSKRGFHELHDFPPCQVPGHTGLDPNAQKLEVIYSW